MRDRQQPVFLHLHAAAGEARECRWGRGHDRAACAVSDLMLVLTSGLAGTIQSCPPCLSLLYGHSDASGEHHTSKPNKSTEAKCDFASIRTCSILRVVFRYKSQLFLRLLRYILTIHTSYVGSAHVVQDTPWTLPRRSFGPRLLVNKHESYSNL